MGILEPITGTLERRRVRRLSWAFNHELDAYARTLARIARPAAVTGGDPSMPMPRRAADALPRVRREYAKFREACRELDKTRDAVVRRLADPDTPPDLAATVRVRFDRLDADHPTRERIAQQKALWEQSLARLVRWAERDPDYAAAAAKRQAAS